MEKKRAGKGQERVGKEEKLRGKRETKMRSTSVVVRTGRS